MPSLTFGYEKFFRVVQSQSVLVQHEYREALLHRLGDSLLVIKVPVIQKNGSVKRVDGIKETALTEAINTINLHLGLDEWSLTGSLKDAMESETSVESDEPSGLSEDELALFRQFMAMKMASEKKAK